MHVWQTLIRRAFRLRYGGFRCGRVILEDLAFHDFAGALWKLSLEMVSMQSGTGVDSGAGAGTACEGTLDVEDDTIDCDQSRDLPYRAVSGGG